MENFETYMYELGLARILTPAQNCWEAEHDCPPPRGWETAWELHSHSDTVSGCPLTEEVVLGEDLSGYWREGPAGPQLILLYH